MVDYPAVVDDAAQMDTQGLRLVVCGNSSPDVFL
jgi:hypothetical protein